MQRGVWSADPDINSTSDQTAWETMEVVIFTEAHLTDSGR